MFTREEKKKLRHEFWQEFKAYSNRKKLKLGKPGKWIMDKTEIKQLKLKFHFDEEKAWAGILIHTQNLDTRIDLWEKLESLKPILESKIPHLLTWELEEKLTEQKTVSCIYAQIKEVNIYKKTCWKQVFKFLFEVMDPIEEVFIEFKDILKFRN